MLHISLTLGVSSDKKIVELYIPLYSFIFLYAGIESLQYVEKSLILLIIECFLWMNHNFFQVFFSIDEKESNSVCSKLIQRNFKIEQHLIMAYFYNRESIKFPN